MALEAWLMFFSRLCCDSLAVRTESHSLILFTRPRTPPKSLDTHVSMHTALSLYISLSDTHTQFTLFCVVLSLSACLHFHSLVFTLTFTRCLSITSALKEPKSNFIELKLRHRHFGKVVHCCSSENRL